MNWLRYFGGFLMVEAATLGPVVGFFADPPIAHFIRTSPWMLVYYAPFAAMAAFALNSKSRSDPQ